MPEQRFAGQVIIVYITISTIIIVKVTIGNRVERQGRDLMDRQKDVSKDSSKLGKEEVSSKQMIV